MTARVSRRRPAIEAPGSVQQHTPSMAESGWQVKEKGGFGSRRIRTSDKVARASRLRVGGGVPPRDPCRPGGGTPPKPAGETPPLRPFQRPTPPPPAPAPKS